jgi:hypothetical protein
MNLKMILRIGISCLIVALAVVTLSPLAAHAASTAVVITEENPIIQTFYTADPAPMVYNGTLYLYADHDEDVTVNNFFTMKDWRVYSTTDMVNWTDYGAQMSLSTFSWAASNAWAGQVVARNGKFYWYVPITKKTGGNAIGVGVSNSPTGPFTDALGVPLIANSQIDPTVFIDDNGQAYLYYGNPDLFYVKLNQDMISYSGGIIQVPLTTASFGTRTGNASRPTLFEEAPWLSKRNGLYYMSFAAACCSEYIAYSTGPSATGPWTYRGVIMPTQGGSFTNHQGIIDFNGNSYFFYHNSALPGGGGYKRSIAVEKFNYNADGTIPTINMTTGGVPQLGTLNPYVTTQAETISWSSGVKTEVSSEGGLDVANIENGDFIKVKGVNFSSGAASFDVRVASATSGGNIEIRLDDSTGGTLLGTCAVTGTGGWQTWVTKTCTVSNATGTHDLYLRFTGGSGFLFNVNWWKFNAAGGGPTPTKTPTPIPGTNFLTNADMESGTTNWVVNGAGTLSSDTTQFHGGARSVKITGRTATWNGIGQNVAVSNFPTSGQNVTVSVWVRSQTGTPTAKATVRLTAGSTTTYVILASAAINSSGWTQLTGTVPVSWSGTLTGVLFYVETAAGTDNIYIDDANLHH